MTETQNGADLPSNRTFVVQFTKETDPAAELYSGRVEHISTGQRQVFNTMEELIAFTTQMLSDMARTRPSSSFTGQMAKGDHGTMEPSVSDQVSEGTQYSAVLPSNRAFVVRLAEETDPAAGLYSGRAEHLLTSQRQPFSTTEEVFAFMKRILFDVAKPASPGDSNGRE